MANPTVGGREDRMKRLMALLLAFSMATAFVFVPPARAEGCLFEYTVKAGDNLYHIGLTFGIPASVIAAVNNLADPNLLFIGQVLCIPAPNTPGPSPTPGPSATPTKTPTPGPTATATTVPTATVTPVAPAPGFVVPTFLVIAVTRNTTITIQTANFPANETFNVTMGYIGTAGVGGHPAGTVESGAGGVFTATIAIPAELADVGQIAVRLQSASGYYSYAWFYNYTSP